MQSFLYFNWFFFFKYFFISNFVLIANNRKKLMFLENTSYFRIFKFSLLTTNNTTHLCHLSLLVSEKILVSFYKSFRIHYEKKNLHNLTNFNLLAKTQYIQYESIYTLSKCMLVFYKYLLWFFSFEWMFGFIF